MEDCEVVRNGKEDEDPEDPQTINEVCVAISALIIVENLTWLPDALMSSITEASGLESREFK